VVVLLRFRQFPGSSLNPGTVVRTHGRPDPAAAWCPSSRGRPVHYPKTLKLVLLFTEIIFPHWIVFPMCYVSTARNGPVYAILALPFVPEFHTGSYQYILCPLTLFLFFCRYILVSLLRSIPALPNFRFVHRVFRTT
jgi:hypothetical protein